MPRWGRGRRPAGRPDLQSVWDFRSATPLERPAELAGKEFLTPEEAAAFEQKQRLTLDMDRRDGGVRDIDRAYNDFWWDFGTSLIVDPSNGKIPPLTPEAERRAEMARGTHPVRTRVGGIGADGPEDRGLAERCLLGFNAGPPFAPSAYNNNVQLFQTPDHVVILMEMIHDARIVTLDGRPPLPNHLRQILARLKAPDRENVGFARPVAALNHRAFRWAACRVEPRTHSQRHD